ncbi:serine palmitoyltransferase small subunit B [Corythoichthys intestinalis]|uniref:serine palmitoyltransferase small subunit B n=1 Tax=Corythoichthys intestinalis TaxID=161448 RepID=UPI0025A63C29|nr:serine palmitoyltransferase small subunit B [Corythoichthys intestinalis]XP_057695448.1 serine palmitoyltransferase small subunit B [Corythoichthys intestinalis]XP_061797503.1 serine palmitoyltransferase small subunit B-like [Nerophis lumbriciformis]
MNFKNLREYLAWLYYQYLLVTGIYVLEPWEKSLFNWVLLSAIAMVIYTSYVFVPIHVRLALEFFFGICGSRLDSAVTGPNSLWALRSLYKDEHSLIKNDLDCIELID